MRTHPLVRLALPALTVTVAAAGLAGCSGPDPQEQAEAAAAALARGLTRDDLADVRFAGQGAPSDPTSTVTDLLGDLGGPDAPDHTVEPGTVTLDDQGAATRLTWTWKLPGRTWTYRTRLDLTQVREGVWRPIWTPTLVQPDLADGDRLAVAAIPAQRGDILGEGGEPLVTARPVVRFGIDKTRLKSRREAGPSAKALARLLDVDPGPYARTVRAAGDEAFVEAITLRRADAGSVSQRQLDRIPGAVGIATNLSLAPTRDFAAALLGRVGEPTAEMIAESKGTLRLGDVVGLSGLEARYDNRLGGTPGTEVRVESPDGNLEPVFSVSPRTGTALRTTLSESTQRAAERALRGVAGASALVALRPSDGAVLAAATGPGSDLNVATFGQYAPGSTFKIVSALAALRSGEKPGSTVDCPATLTVDGRQFKNYSDYPSSGLGRITLASALANSCNTAFIGLRERIEPSALIGAAAALGMGVDHDMGYPSYFGSVPEPQSATERAAELIGQGRVQASPLTMATVIASAAAGHAVLPRLVQGQGPESADPPQPMTRSEATRLRAMLRAVVERGSGQVLAPYGVQGAKTGTAEYGEASGGGALKTHAWMVAYKGDLAMAAFVETGDSGSGTAGPILEDFLSSLR